ncbi:hypothetical protein BGZ49_004566 [Haplosporangium sp. Z 27]|nr:hypothetical protein BGZ49_004566 [Haplosporangium sp. Z 27]
MQSPPPQDPSHQHTASAPLQSTDRKEIFRLGFGNYDVVSLHLDRDRTERRYDLCLAIAERRQDPNAEGDSVEELRQPLTTSMEA